VEGASSAAIKGGDKNERRTKYPNQSINQSINQSLTKDTLLIFKNGNFYNCYQTDAIIINFLFGYLITVNEKCGFPESALTKVLNKLEEDKISYQIIYRDKNPYVKSFDNLNNYEKIAKKAYDNLDVQTRMGKIIERIEEVDDIEILENIIKAIENELH